MNCIGIDIGTTGICGISVDCSEGRILKKISLDNDTFIKSEHDFERIQNAEAIFEKVSLAIENLADEDTAGIGFSNQMHGILYTDKNGSAVSPLYTWQDARGGIEYKDKKSYAEHLGSFPGYGLVTDFYNRENSLIPDGAEYLLTIGDYAVMKLCGKTSPLMHTSNAASLGLFDYQSMSFKIQNDLLPEITDNYVPAGEYRGIPVIVSLGDNQASFLGSVRDNDSALINFGTGSQISVMTDSSLLPDCFEARPLGNKRQIAAGCALCGGRAFRMAERFIAQCAGIKDGTVPESLYKQIDELLQNKSETTMLADTRFCGTRKNPQIKGAFYNIDENNFTPQDMLLSVLDGMSRELYDMYAMLESGCKNLVCSGNGIRKNPALQRIVSSMFDMPLLFPEYKEEAAYGAALCAMAGTGVYDDIDSARQLIKY